MSNKSKILKFIEYLLFWGSFDKFKGRLLKSYLVFVPLISTFVLVMGVMGYFDIHESYYNGKLLVGDEKKNFSLIKIGISFLGYAFFWILLKIKKHRNDNN